MNIKILTLSILSLAGLALWGASCILMNPEDVSALPLTTGNTTKLSHQAAPQTGIIYSVQLLDSHTWVVKSADGTVYDPVNLPDSLKVEGAQVSFSYRNAPDWGYTYASGELIEITQVARIK